MERRYRYFRHQIDDYGKMPLLEVRLRHGDEYIDIDCLVDSGAVDSMFNIDIADELGIDLEGLEERDYEGMDGNVVAGRVSKVSLEIRGLAQPVIIQAAFIEGNDIPILGQNGFFDSFKVCFQRYQGKFEIIPVSDARADEYLM
jgi:hypothetical protein